MGLVGGTWALWGAHGPCRASCGLRAGSFSSGGGWYGSYEGKWSSVGGQTELCGELHGQPHRLIGEWGSPGPIGAHLGLVAAHVGQDRTIRHLFFLALLTKYAPMVSYSPQQNGDFPRKFNRKSVRIQSAA